jgi:hypothetical protein
MRIGETIATYDVGLALRGKSGKFEVTSPTGETYDVTCKPSHSGSSLEWSSLGADNLPFLIRKLAERAATSETTPTTSEMHPVESQSAPSHLPFVLEQLADHAPVSSSAGKIELLYLDDDPEFGQISACICLTESAPPRDHAVEAKTLLTSQCVTFNQLDSEIRRLQAELDEIRSRAKKMFYKTQAIQASA